VTPDLRMLAYAAALTWLMLMASAFFRTRWWTWRGLHLAMGNRGEMPEPTALAGRVDRAAKNMLENFVLFAALLLGAHAANVAPSRLELGAELFFWSRLAYFPVYLAGIPYLRTALWAVGVVGMGLVFWAMFSAG
jgi:uncharacterized MAPEG superfamily protein